MNKRWLWLAELPTTNLRIAVTLVMAIGTGARVLLTSWDVPGDWLTFLTVWAGLDVVQFGTKRATYKPET